MQVPDRGESGTCIRVPGPVYERPPAQIAYMPELHIRSTGQARSRIPPARVQHLGGAALLPEYFALPAIWGTATRRIPWFLRDAAPRTRRGRSSMTIQRMDNVLIVVEDLDAVIAFFVELGMELEGTGPVEGPWVDAVIGIEGARQSIAMLRIPGADGRIELAMFHSPDAISVGPRDAPANTLGIRRIMFAVDDIDDVVERLRLRGAELMGELAQYEDAYRLCYVRGPEGIVVGLAQQLS